MSLSSLGSASAIALAVIFGLAAASKLRNRDGTARSFTELGLPAPHAAAIGVPAVELVIALSLLLVPPIGSVAALVTLVFFTAFLAKRQSEGATAPCACFGATSTHPIGWMDLVRNVGLIALGLLALAAPQPLDPTAPALGLVGALVLLGAGMLHRIRPREPTER